MCCACRWCHGGILLGARLTFITRKPAWSTRSSARLVHCRERSNRSLARFRGAQCCLIMSCGEVSPVRPTEIRMRRVVIIASVAAVYTFSVSGGIINGSPVGNVISSYAPPYFAMLWASKDSARTRYWPAYHYGLYLWLLWFIVVPHYVLKTRGRRGVGLALALSMILWAPALMSFIGWYFYESLPDFR